MREPIAPTERTLLSVIEERPRFYLGLGIALVIAGAAAILLPYLATLAAEALLGAILVVAGVALGTHGFSAKGHGGTLHLVGAALYVALGVLLLLFPVAGIVTLTVLVAAFFLAEGVLRLVQAARLWGLPGAGWLLGGGLLAVALAIVILVALPGSAAWTLGVLLGIDLLFSGGWLIWLSRVARRRLEALHTGRPHAA